MRRNKLAESPGEVVSVMTAHNLVVRSRENLARKRSRLAALALSGLLLCVFTANAANNWYVRPSSAGSNSGQDWNNAWSISSINWSSVQPGDTIWLAGGAYASGITFTKSGSAGSPIYLLRVLSTDSAPTLAPGWSSSFDSQVVMSPSSGNVLNFTANYITIDGRVNNGILCNIPNAGSCNGALMSGHNNIVLANLELAGPGVNATISGTMSSWGANGASSILTTNCNMHGCVQVATMLGCTGCIFDHCYLHDSGCANTSSFHPNMVEYSSSSGNIFRYCTYSTWPVEGYFMYGGSSSLTIYGCIIHDPSSGGVATFLWDSNYGQSTPTSVLLYNNTFVNVAITSSQAQQGGMGASQARNNIYWNSTWDPTYRITDDDYGFSSASASGAHSISSGSNPFVNLSGGDYHIVATVGSKYPKDMGVALGASYNVDLDGNTRGLDGTWDIGAYEYASSIIVEPVISNFQRVPAQNSATMTWTTDQSANSIVKYGLTAAYGTSVTNSSMVTSHSVTINNLTAGTLYHCQVASIDNTNSLNASSDYTFTTTAGTPPTVSPIVQANATVDTNLAGLYIYADSSKVQYSGSASDPSGLPLSWQWIYTVNGGSEIVYQSGTGSVSSTTFTYGPSTAGNVYVWKLRVSNGTATAESDLTVAVEAPPLPPGTLTFSAGSGTLTGPFVLANGSISQSVETGVTNGGVAVYNFTITNAVNTGTNFVVQVLINAPSTAANSLYVNIDGQPQDPGMIWDVPITAGFVQKYVSWRGNGTTDNNQFNPKVFSLTAGPHQLIIVGREANVQLQSFSILQRPTMDIILHVTTP
jgi:hypothetical protein